MTQPTPSPPTVEMMWRPGCPFCASLRRGLGRAGVATTEHDIWSSTDAAARVREATGGDETVPTVFVGDQALVNPSVRQVVAAIRSSILLQPDSTPAASSDRTTTQGPSPGLRWTLVVAVVWSVLVVWRPTTTWHLAPLILAAAWPWVVGQDTSPGDPSARRRILLAGGGGLGASLALTGLLSLTGRLDGPDVDRIGSACGRGAPPRGRWRRHRHDPGPAAHRASAATQQQHQHLPLEGSRGSSGN